MSEPASGRLFRSARCGAILALSRLVVVDKSEHRLAVYSQHRDEKAASDVGAVVPVVLIDVARLAYDVIGDLRRSGEPLLAEVFAVIDRGHSEALSLRDVARELGLTPTPLTKPGQEWIIERRLAASRSLFTDTGLPVAVVARRVGVSDQGYFRRLFRRTHGTSPRNWRGWRGTYSV